MPQTNGRARAPMNVLLAKSRGFAPTLSTWVVGAVVIVTLMVLALTAGIPGFLVCAGGVGIATSFYVVLSGRRSWALLPNRRFAGIALAMSLGVLVSGISLGGPTLNQSELAATGLGMWSETLPPGSEATPFPATTATTSPTAGVTAADSPQNPGAEFASGSTSVPEGPQGSAPAATAAQVLAAIPIKGRAPKTGYDRTGMFGEAWIDDDNNGCDTRNDILARDLTAVTTSGTCRVLTGTLNSPYTAAQVDFVRGNDTSALVQIDHLVALSNAWQTGAQQLTQSQRVSLANDPLNLLAVDGRSNSQKGDGDAATWLPSNKSIRCSYIARQISVKASYGLWVTQAEHDAMAGILSGCENEPALLPTAAPESTPIDVGPVAPPVVAEPLIPDPAVTAPPELSPAPSAFYENCDAVRAAGAAPITSEQPGYSYTLDRDKDGIACET
jgi:hypothetical protein